MPTTNGLTRHRPLYRWPADAPPTASGIGGRLTTDLACRAHVPPGPTTAERFEAAELRLRRTAGLTAARELLARGVRVALTRSGGVAGERLDGRRLTPRQEARLHRHAANLALYLASL